MEIQEYQDKYEAYNNAIKAIKEDMKLLTTSAEKDGLYFANGIFKKSGTIIGCVIREAYYDKYVGERGAMYDGSQSAYNTELTIEEFDAMYDNIVALKEKEITQGPLSEEEYESVFEFLVDYFPERLYPPYRDAYEYKKNPNKYYEDCVAFFEDITVSNKTISYRYIGEGDQGEYVDGSGFDLGHFDEKWITNFKSSSYENKFDVYGYHGQVKW